MTEPKRRDRMWVVLVGLAALIVPALAGYIIYFQSRTPMLGFYPDESEPPVVTQVIAGGAAEAAGLRAGDVILAVDGIPFAAWDDKQIGHTSTWDILRGGQSVRLTVQMGTMLQANRGQASSALLAALVFWGTGLLLLWRRRERPDVRLLFWLFQSVAVAVLPGLAFPRFRLPPAWMLFLEFVGLYLAAALLAHFHLTFPVVLGSMRQRRWAVGLLYGLAVVGIIDAALRAAPWQSGAMFGALAEGVAAIGIVVYVYFRRATLDGRRRLRIVVAGTVLGLMPPILGYILPSVILGYTPDVPRWLVSLCLAIVPLSYLYATARHNLFGIDHLLNRALVYGILSVGIFAFYLTPLLVLDRFLASGWLLYTGITAGLTLPVALAFDPTRRRVQRQVDRLFYGGWYDYPRVVETVSDALARSLEWDQVADVLTRQVPTLMQLHGAQLIVSEHCTVPLEPSLQPRLQLELGLEGQERGVWVVGPRRDGEDFSATDRRIFNTLVNEAEIALSNVLLVETLRAQLDEIRASRESLTRVERQLLRTREEERARLARDLHDGPLQILIGLNMQLGLLAPVMNPAHGTAAQSTATQNNTPLAEAVPGLRAQVRDLVTELRQVCAELRPPMLDTLGLGAALRVLAQDWSNQHDLPVRLDLPPDAALRAVPGEVAVNLYRVAQEALSNIAHHAAARHVNLDLVWEADTARLTLVVQDNGRGFTCNTAQQGHFGLVGMQERAALIGGQWTLESAPDQGTTVRVTWQRPDVADE